MPKKTQKKFSIDHLSILNPNGVADPKLEPKIDPTQLLRMFEQMILMREFDKRAVSLQRQGRMGTYAATWGQEAANIGSAVAMETQDWAVPCFREQGVYLSRGVSPHLLFLFYMGSEEGNRLPKNAHTLPMCVPCATQLLHAVGIARAAQIKKEKSAVVAYIGDGAVSEGDFHEALNFASVFQLPIVFLCQNNQWAISTPFKQQTHSETIAQKAISYGMPGLQVDGNDILAVYTATKEALDLAKNGMGPSFLECLTYRIAPHTTSDDPQRYRDPKEVEVWETRDPILRFEKYLLRRKLIKEGDRKKIANRQADILSTQAEKAEEICRRLTPKEMFQYTFANTPAKLKHQSHEAMKLFLENNPAEVVHG